MTANTVPATAWHDAVAEAVSTHPWLAYVGAIDGAGERGQDPDIIVVCRVENHDGDDSTISTRVPRDHGTLDSVVDVLAGASWYEREIHDFFGVRFVGPGADNRPLLIHEAPKPPLRKDVVLAQRADTIWPGAADRAASTSRRLPAGVPDPATWQRIKDGENVADTEVIAAMTGRRPRGRRAASTSRTASRR